MNDFLIPPAARYDMINIEAQLAALAEHCSIAPRTRLRDRFMRRATPSKSHPAEQSNAESLTLMSAHLH
jgi:hypothetical protein